MRFLRVCRSFQPWVEQAACRGPGRVRAQTDRLEAPPPCAATSRKVAEADSARRGRDRPQAPLLDEGKRGTQSAPHDADGSGATAGRWRTALVGTIRTLGAPAPAAMAVPSTIRL